MAVRIVYREAQDFIEDLLVEPPPFPYSIANGKSWAPHVGHDPTFVPTHLFPPDEARAYLTRMLHEVREGTVLVLGGPSSIPRDTRRVFLGLVASDPRWTPYGSPTPFPFLGEGFTPLEGERVGNTPQRTDWDLLLE